MPNRESDAHVLHDPSLLAYDASPPFAPSVAYPEYPFGDAGASGTNRVYGAVREYLRLFGGDRERYGQPEWNPLGFLVRPGQTVLVKPNWVKHRNDLDLTVDAIITHPSVVRPILDYVLIALRGEGRVIVGDAPIQSCDFDALCEARGIYRLIEYYRGRASVPVDLVDFRKEHAVTALQSVVVERRAAAGDPNGYGAVQLGAESALAPVDARASRYRVTNYDPNLMELHHRPGHHEYLVAGSVLRSDVVFFVPKMKTHRKAGITVALKNSVGINGSKDWLPHHSQGALVEGGDEYQHPSVLKRTANSLHDWIERVPSAHVKRALGVTSGALRQVARAAAKDAYFEGGWYGNDTVWRMVLDLNRALLYADARGEMRPERQRRAYFLADGIVAGEGDGPVSARPKPCGLLIGGASAPTVDAAAASLMGFDYRKIPLVREAFALDAYPLVDFPASRVRVRANAPDIDGMDLLRPRRTFGFVPSSGWRGHIELDTPGQRRAS